jgi:glycine hydroxymethyltransferase
MKRGYKVISGGTDNHLFLVDLVNSEGLENLGGEEASTLLEDANITLNKNTIPNDPRKPWDPSGVRIGTPALTTRGMKEKEMEKVAEYIDTVLKNREDKAVIEKTREEVKDFASEFLIPGISG